MELRMNNLEFYKRQPDKFLYDFFGIELNSVQKKLLDKVVKEDEGYITYPMYRGYTDYKYIRWLLYQMLFGGKDENN